MALVFGINILITCLLKTFWPLNYKIDLISRLTFGILLVYAVVLNLMFILIWVLNYLIINKLKMSILKPTLMLLFFSVTLKAFTQTSTPAIPSIHSQSITTITNTSLSLSRLAGKKIVFIIAPLSVKDTAKVRAIKEFQNKYDTYLFYYLYDYP